MDLLTKKDFLYFTQEANSALKIGEKQKIKAALKQKGVTDYCIKKALVEIDDTEYQNTLKKLIVKKSKELKEKNKSSLRLKLSAYAISKGFEREVVWDIINNLLNT